MCQTYMCILLYVKLIWCSGISQIFGQLEEGESWYMCIFLSVKPFSVAVFLTSMINWMGYICPQCMCILLYVKLIWCSGISQIYVQLEEGESWYMCILLSVKPLEVAVFHTSMINQMGDPSLLSIHAFCQMLNIFGVVVFHRSNVNWGRGAWYMCVLLYVKLILCRGIPYINGQLEGYICPKYMCIVLYVKCICCSSIPYIYGQLDWGYICPQYMCILLYVKLIQCSGISLIYGELEEGTLVYVHSAICETFWCSIIPYIFDHLEGIHLP